MGCSYFLPKPATQPEHSCSGPHMTSLWGWQASQLKIACGHCIRTEQGAPHRGGSHPRPLVSEGALGRSEPNTLPRAKWHSQVIPVAAPWGGLLFHHFIKGGRCTERLMSSPRLHSWGVAEPGLELGKSGQVCPQMLPFLLQSREGSERLSPGPLFTWAGHLSALFSSPVKSG